MNKEIVGKALAAVQKQIDNIIQQYATTGPVVVLPGSNPDHTPLIQAIQVRDMLQREQNHHVN
jgi:hypothetical protein